MDDVQRREITEQWERLKKEKAPKGDRLKALSSKFSLSQKQVRAILIEEGCWYDSKMREKEWSRENIRRDPEKLREQISVRRNERAEMEAQNKARLEEIKDRHRGSLLDRSLQFWGIIFYIFLFFMIVTLLFGAVASIF